MTEAAILAYGTNQQSLAGGHPGRQEHAIVYKSTNWDDLCRLLECPVAFFKTESMVNSPISWSLLTGCTIVLEPMQRDPSTAVRCAHLLGWPGPGDADVSSEPSGTFSLASAHTLAKNYLDGPTSPSDGAFIAEFATYTRTLFIRYLLPDPIPNNPRFGGTLTAATHVPIGDGKIGNIHFDVEFHQGENERNRACFVLDYIEDGRRITSKLSGLDFFNNAAQLNAVKAGSPLQVDDPTLVATAAVPSVVRDPTAPRIVIEGASVPDLPAGCCVCIDGDTRIPFAEVIMGNLIVKCYACQ